MSKYKNLKGMATQKQKEHLDKLGIEYDKETLTKQAASHLISYVWEQHKLPLRKAEDILSKGFCTLSEKLKGWSD